MVKQASLKRRECQSRLRNTTLFELDTVLSHSPACLSLLLTLPSKTHSDKRDESSDSCRGTESVSVRLCVSVCVCWGRVMQEERCREAYWWRREGRDIQSAPHWPWPWCLFNSSTHHLDSLDEEWHRKPRPNEQKHITHCSTNLPETTASLQKPNLHLTATTPVKLSVLAFCYKKAIYNYNNNRFTAWNSDFTHKLLISSQCHQLKWQILQTLSAVIS